MGKVKKVLAVNGSPRKNWNTATLLQKALDGAASAGAQTELIHLYDLTYQGCISCFYCKKNATWRAAKCAVRDDLTGVLEKATACDVLLMGSPIYLSDVTGAMRAFWERLVFMNIAYEQDGVSVFEGRVDCGVIYTMNIPGDAMAAFGYPAIYESNMRFLSVLNGRTEYMTANDTYQFDDYAKYHAPRFDPAHKKQVRDEQFPLDCERAFQMGARLAGEGEK